MLVPANAIGRICQNNVIGYRQDFAGVPVVDRDSVLLLVRFHGVPAFANAERGVAVGWERSRGIGPRMVRMFRIAVGRVEPAANSLGWRANLFMKAVSRP